MSDTAARWLSSERDFPGSQPTLRRYVVLSTPRSGSTLLGECLRAVAAGDPLEYFHENVLATYRRTAKGKQHATYRDLLQVMERRRTSPNGTFGMKVHFYQFNRVFGVDIHTVGRDWLRHQQALIRVYRRDRLAQAVSRTKAVATQQWSSIEVPVKAYSFAGTAKNYSNLVGNLLWVVRDELQWMDFCAQHGFQTLDVAYEDLRDDLSSTLGRVLKYIGVPDTSADLKEPPLRALADNQSAEVRASLLAYLTGARDPL